MATGPRVLARTATIAGSLVGAFSLVALPAAPAPAATNSFYVDRTVAGCSDSGPGTSGTPYCTVAKGVSALSAGATLYVGNGTYAETVTPTVSGTASSPVTITAWPGRHPVVGAGVGSGVTLSSKSYVTISDLVVAGTIGAGISVSGGSNVTLSGNEVRNAGSPARGRIAVGINLHGTTDSLVTGNYTHDNSNTGIYLSSGATRDTVSENVSTHNANGYQRNANGIDVISPGNTLLANRTYNTEDSGIQFYPGGNDNLAMLNVSY
ncbi:MAG: right-handed parallel beta-helix repeat-containing protein, partial [Nocardioidaceae bacterium]